MTLDQLGIKHGTDKNSQHHGYLDIYEKYLFPLKNKPILLIEAGIGGYEFHNRGGQSLRMWCEYFPHGRIVSFDIHDKSGIKVPLNGLVAQGSEDDGTFLNSLVEIVGKPDIVINDGSHINALSIASFEILFPHLKSGGIYIWEDLHTSYWEKEYGGRDDLKNQRPDTAMNYLTFISNLLNREHMASFTEKVKPEMNNKFTEIVETISSVHFYKETAIIIKK